MYCRNCGAEMPNAAEYCIKCGVPKNKGNRYCQGCGAQTHPEAVVCISCGVGLGNESGSASARKGRSKLIAGLLGIFLGCFGVHNFYLGYTKKAVCQMVLSIVSIVTMTVAPFLSMIFLLDAAVALGISFMILAIMIPLFLLVGMCLWGFIEGIIILSGKKTDADGVPLSDGFDI